MRIKLLLEIITFMILAVYSQKALPQTTIGSDIPPRSGSLLELKQTDSKGANSTKGLGLPRVKLIRPDTLAPAVADATDVQKLEHEGLTIYNVTDTTINKLIEVIELKPGLYTWINGKWQSNSLTERQNNNRLIVGDTLSNSFIVDPQKTIRVPVTKAYNVWKDNIPLNHGIPVDLTTIAGVRGVKLIWQDRKSLVNDAATLQLVVPAEGEKYAYVDISFNQDVAAQEGGNALIAFTIDGTVYWSWHLWITYYNPDNYDKTLTRTGANVVDAGYVYQPTVAGTLLSMDRNLGALQNAADYKVGASIYGMCYQYGRKDPIPSINSTFYNGSGTVEHQPLYDANDNTVNIAQSSVAYTLAESVNNPAAISQQLNGNYHWYKNSSGTVVLKPLWRAEDSTQGDNSYGGRPTDGRSKSVFDPCPLGWVVSDFSPLLWDNATVNPGSLHTMQIVVPAAAYSGGYRQPIAGVFYPNASVLQATSTGFSYTSNTSGIIDLWHSTSATTYAQVQRFNFYTASSSPQTAATLPTSNASANALPVRCVTYENINGKN